MNAFSLDRIRDIATAAEAADGVAPLDEATWLALRHHPEQVDAQVADHGFTLLIRGELSLVVSPDQRGRGYGDTLARGALEEHTSLAAWSHGDHPAARALARRHGFRRVRELWVMRRPSVDPLPDAVVPEGITLRGYREGDQPELLRVNAAAFAAHPEQGAMDATNLDERMAEPWFDPAGLLVATREDRMLGFH
ncbi:MAG: mycothiol synthase [Nocardioides sp.]